MERLHNICKFWFIMFETLSNFRLHFSIWTDIIIHIRYNCHHQEWIGDEMDLLHDSFCGKTSIDRLFSFQSQKIVTNKWKIYLMPTCACNCELANFMPVIYALKAKDMQINPGFNSTLLVEG